MHSRLCEVFFPDIHIQFSFFFLRENLTLALLNWLQ